MDKVAVAERIFTLLNEAGIECTAEKAELLADFTDLLLEYNEKFNLTAVTGIDDIIKKHYVDSLKGLKKLVGCRRVVDIGCGAGLPSIPLKIFLPDTEFVLLDSLNKRIGFVETAIAALSLTKISCRHMRIEEAARLKEYRSSFDAVVARAVAELNTLVEYAMPLLRVGGTLVAYKGPSVTEEMLRARRAFVELKCEIVEAERFSLYDAKRCLLTVKKTQATPNKYPRSGNKARTAPIS